jgi:hypothetical protein
VAGPNHERSPDDDPTARLRSLSSRAEDKFFDDSSPHLDHFGSLLAVTIVAVVALSLTNLEAIDDSLLRGMLRIVLSTTTGVALVLALRASGVARRGRRIAEFLVVFAFVTSVVVIVAEQVGDVDAAGWQSDRPSPLWVLIALLTPVAVVHRLVSHRTVSTGTLAGAIAAYLLVAIAFCYLFLFVDGALDGGFFVGGSEVASHEFMYFSLVSITTVGYGDLTPNGPVAQLLATTEAVIGQVYLVTFVAMLVGLMIQQRESSTMGD